MTYPGAGADVASLRATVDRLTDSCERLEGDRLELVTELEAAVEQLEAAEAELHPMYDALRRADEQAQALTHRVEMLERRLENANTQVRSTQDQLLAERAWVCEQAQSVAASQSWRVGHRLVRAARAVTLRGDRGADGLTVIVRRMEGGAEEPGAR